MSKRSIHVFQGRLKKTQMVWRSASALSAPLDISDATCTIHSHNLSAAPTISILDAVSGRCEITFSPESTKSLTKGSANYFIWVALTYASNPGYSPDPIKIQVTVG